ncbi:hypothetical protein ABZ749_17660, partial [Micromonospora sp. NPDC047753]|uniref:hypothetical protein n=1 Tax=Micromonospora sp. NPDC047753 TaxID=3154817 RepID=UPI0033F3CCEA
MLLGRRRPRNDMSTPSFHSSPELDYIPQKHPYFSYGDKAGLGLGAQKRTDLLGMAEEVGGLRLSSASVKSSRLASA